MTIVPLPQPDGTVVPYRPAAPTEWPRPDGLFTSRIAFAAAHVAADPFGDNVPGAAAAIDWDATLAFRRHLWSYGLGVAEAMDTAQRGMGLDWPAAELIRRSAAEARACGGRIAAGAGTDQRPDAATVADVVAAYEEQCVVVEQAGARVILMASRRLATVAARPDDYQRVYGKLLAQVAEPAILHWLGPVFGPALTGYWGSADLTAATGHFVELVTAHADRVDGVTVSLLDRAHEARPRELLPEGVRVYTGDDDFHYPELIAGDGTRHSDALLGVFAAIAPRASAALRAPDDGDRDTLVPTVPLARHLFGPPTYHYKTGIAFLAWLAGHQPGFTMVGGAQSARGVVHLARAYRMADELGLFPDPERTAAWMRDFLRVAGVDRG